MGSMSPRSPNSWVFVWVPKSTEKRAPLKKTGPPLEVNMLVDDFAACVRDIKAGGKPSDLVRFPSLCPFALVSLSVAGEPLAQNPGK